MSLAELSLMSPVDTSFLGKSLASPSSASSQNATRTCCNSTVDLQYDCDDNAAHGGKIHHSRLCARCAALCYFCWGLQHAPAEYQICWVTYSIRSSL
jgi:hypothetical protein